MKARFLQLLTFLRLVDQHDGLVSLTNLALLVAIAKIATTQALGMEDLGLLIAGLLAYAGKKAQFAKTQRDEGAGATAELEAKLEALDTRVAGAEDKANRVLNTMALKTNGLGR